MVDLEARFWSHVEGDGDCLIWKGARDTYGYGKFYTRPGRAGTSAHRWIWVQKHGEIDPKLVLHHTCHRKLCVNDAHLGPLTRRRHTSLHRKGKGENVPREERLRRQKAVRDQRRSEALADIGVPNRGKNRRATCLKGHLFTPDNIHTEPTGRVRCRTCMSDRNARRRLVRKLT